MGGVDMHTELEKKYLICEEKANALKRLASRKQIVIQWYFESKFEHKIGYILNWPHEEIWIDTVKNDTNLAYARFEKERFISKEKALSIIKDLPVTAKIRYIILREQDREVVLDEFVQLDQPYKVPIKYMVEIEAPAISKIDELARIYRLTNEISAKDYAKYTNKNLAVKTKYKPEEIIELVKMKIIGG